MNFITVKTYFIKTSLETVMVGEKEIRLIMMSIVIMMATGVEIIAQIGCNRVLPDDEFPKAAGNQWDLIYPMNAWNGFVFQLDPGYNAFADRNSRQFLHTTAQRVYKGYLIRDDVEFLPQAGLNFDTDFGSIAAQSTTVPGGGNLDDTNFFDTGNTPLTDDGCDVERRHFGILMFSRFEVPETGVYRVTVGSDDGTYMRMFEKIGVDDVLLQDVNGDNLIHNNWVKIPADTLNFDGYYNYLYADNIRNYYVELTAGDEIYIDLSYYEKTNINRLSFNIELYYGPGEIRINDVLQTNSETYCAIDPNPDPFFSKGPAVFENGTLNSYFWEWSLVNDPNGTWNTLTGETGSTYDIPAMSVEPWGGTRFYRRGASGTTEINGNPVNVVVHSNVLEINMNAISFPVGGLNQYGVGEWHGYIYDGVARNQESYFSDNPQKYIGKHIVGVGPDTDFVEGFNFNSGPRFVPNVPGSCGFYPDYFSVQFLREMEVQPGTYEFTISADDGYRLFIDDVLVSNTPPTPVTWDRAGGSATSQKTITYEALTTSTIQLRLEYYEIANSQVINFGQVYQALPVEWGQVTGVSCGDNNCLTWETLQEKFTSHFVVERSYDGLEWTPIGEAVSAQGFSTQATTYQVTDASFKRERSFYRVKQVDIDGTMDYSETIRIDNPSFQMKMMPYPNPTVDQVRFYSEDEVLLVQVSSFAGNVNYRAAFDSVGQHLYELDLSNQQNGQYVITVVTKSARTSHKIFKR